MLFLLFCHPPSLNLSQIARLLVEKLFFNVMKKWKSNGLSTALRMFCALSTISIFKRHSSDSLKTAFPPFYTPVDFSLTSIFQQVIAFDNLFPTTFLSVILLLYLNINIIV